MQEKGLLTRKRELAMAATALMVAAVLYYVLRPAAVPVDTAVAARGPLTVTVAEEGKTRIKDLFTVSAPISGRLLRSPLEVGDEVKKQITPVASIEPGLPPFLDFRTQSEVQAQIKASRAAVELARADISQMQAELDFAQKELERTQALSARDVVSERALEKSKTDVETRKAALARAQANLTIRQRELESTMARAIGPANEPAGTLAQTCCFTVTSPVSGRVLEIYKKSEQIVPQGTPLIDIGDPSNLEIVVELLSADAVRVKEGAQATITAWGGRDLAAKVKRVEPAGFTKVSALGIEEQRVRVLLDLHGAPSEDAIKRLGHGYRVYVRITVNELSDALLVPLAALFRHKESWSVYVDKDGIAQLRRIEIGFRDALRAELKSGLAQGERIILHPSDRVTDGVRVTERSASK